MSRTVLDLHCHILPGVDDGATSWEMSLEMARCLREAGFNEIAPSPHYGSGPGGNVPIARAKALREEFEVRLRKAGIDLVLHPNAEHHVCPLLFGKLEANQAVPIGGQGDWILTELPWRPLMNPEDILFRLQSKGHKVLLAHPERYRYLEMSVVESLVDCEIKMQLELGSFVGVYGRTAQSRAELIADQGWGHVVATDLHRPEQWLERALQVFTKRYGESAASKALSDSPRAVVANVEAHCLLPFNEGAP